MRFFFGVIIGLLTLFLFYNALLNTVPGNNYYAWGSNFGSHLSWVLPAVITYFLLRKKKKSLNSNKVDEKNIQKDKIQSLKASNQENINEENKKSFLTQLFSKIDDFFEDMFGMGSKSNNPQNKKKQK